MASRTSAIHTMEVGPPPKIAEMLTTAGHVAQGLIPLLLERITQYFPAASIYSPADHGYRGATNWPSMDKMMAAGKRVLLLSGIDYGSSMDALIFDKWVLILGPVP